MGVYIKDMEMPQTCIDCPLYRYTAISHYCCVAAIRGQRATERDKDCPLVEVKTPHGRLIDADELEKAIYEWMPKDQETWMESKIPPIENLVVSIMMTINEQPTIIEA